jgi:hypothetical protein
MSGARTPAFSVLFLHDCNDGAPARFMEFTRSEKVEAFRCLQRLSQAWPNTTYFLRRERKTIARIKRGEIHLPRGHATRRAREQFRSQMRHLTDGTHAPRLELRTGAPGDDVTRLVASVPNLGPL